MSHANPYTANRVPPAHSSLPESAIDRLPADTRAQYERLVSLRVEHAAALGELGSLERRLHDARSADVRAQSERVAAGEPLGGPDPKIGEIERRKVELTRQVEVLNRAVGLAGESLQTDWPRDEMQPLVSDLIDEGRAASAEARKLFEEAAAKRQHAAALTGAAVVLDAFPHGRGDLATGGQPDAWRDARRAVVSDLGALEAVEPWSLRSHAGRE